MVRSKPTTKRATVAKARRVDQPGEPLPGGSHLGDLGVVHDEVDVTFGYFGTVLRVNPELSELELVEFMDRAQQVGENDPRAVTMLKDYLRSLVHPDDFDRFWELARRYRQTQQDLGALTQTLMAAAAGRPTGLPSDSSAGQSSTAPSSRDGSSLRVIRQLESQGRSDIALAVVRAQEAQAAG